MGRLDSKGALITGGASGMGMVASKLFASEGAAIVLTDVADDAGEAVASEIEAAGGQALYVHTDVSDEADAEAMVKAAGDRVGGRLDHQRRVVRRVDGRRHLADRLHGVEGRRALDDARDRGRVRAEGDPVQRAVSRTDRHTAAGGASGRAGTASAAIRPHPDGTARASGGAREGGPVPRERRLLVTDGGPAYRCRWAP